jgi:hypothetical protein
MIRALIAALGQTNHPDAASALLSIQSIDWPAAVKRLAADELAKVQ